MKSILKNILLEVDESRIAYLKNKFSLSDNFIEKHDLVYYSYNNLGYERKQLPQIDKEDIQSLITHFKKYTKVERLVLPLYLLNPIQGELNSKKILKKLSSNDTQWSERTYICSKDYEIIDGHHDFACGLEFCDGAEVDVVKINLPIKQLLKRIKQMKISYKRDIIDNLLENYGIKKN